MRSDWKAIGYDKNNQIQEVIILINRTESEAERECLNDMIDHHDWTLTRLK